MPELKNPMEIFKLLNKSNCRECYEKTCLAFAAAVYQGRKPLEQCPHLDDIVLERYGGGFHKQKTIRDDLETTVETLTSEIVETDLESRAKIIGGRYENGKLTLKIFGKDFSVHSNGRLSSDIHINPWITIPLLGYVLTCSKRPVSGKWMPLRELPGGKQWAGLFSQRCEKPLKAIADQHTNLFQDMIHLFNGKPVTGHYDSDVALVLHPFPKVPILLCYWLPEGGLGSDLTLFFDATAEEHLGIEAIYGLGAGLVRMFEKIALRHGAVSAKEN